MQIETIQRYKKTYTQVGLNDIVLQLDLPQQQLNIYNDSTIQTSIVFFLLND